MGGLVVGYVGVCVVWCCEGGVVMRAFCEDAPRLLRAVAPGWLSLPWSVPETETGRESQRQFRCC